MKTLILSTIDEPGIRIMEGEDALERRIPNSIAVVESVLGNWKLKNKNNRLYSKERFWLPLMQENEMFKFDLENKRLLGETDHPEGTAVGTASRMSHITTKIWLEDDGRVMGLHELLPTPEGFIMKTLLEAGVKYGVSSRAMCESSYIEGVEDMVGSTCEMKGWDFVVDPSTVDGYVTKLTIPQQESIYEAVTTMEKSGGSYLDNAVYARLKPVVESVKARNASGGAEVLELTARVESLQKALESLSAKNKSKPVVSEDKNEDVDKLKELYRESLASVRKLRTDLDNEAKLRSESETLLVGLVTKYEANQKKHVEESKKIKKVSTELKRVKDSNKKLESELESTFEMLEGLNASYEDLSERYKKTTTEARRLKKDVAASKESLKDLRVQYLKVENDAKISAKRTKMLESEMSLKDKIELSRATPVNENAPRHKRVGVEIDSDSFKFESIGDRRRTADKSFLSSVMH